MTKSGSQLHSNTLKLKGTFTSICMDFLFLPIEFIKQSMLQRSVASWGSVSPEA